MIVGLVAVAGLAPPIHKHAVSILGSEDVVAAGCDRAAAGISAFLPVLVSVAEIGSEVMLAGDGADVAAGLTGGIVFAEKSWASKSFVTVQPSCSQACQ